MSSSRPPRTGTGNVAAISVWPGRAVRVAAAALAAAGAVALSGCGGAEAPADPPPAVTVTVTVAVTSTVRVPAAPSEPTPYERTPAPDAQRWAVRTPAGMVCGFDSAEITCRGDYDSGATAMRWRVGAAAAEPDEDVTVPDDGQELAYGTQRNAGPWSLQMSEDGITFTHNGTGAKAMFSRAGATIG